MPLSDFNAFTASEVLTLERADVILEPQDSFAPNAPRKIRDRRRHAPSLIVHVCSGIANGLSAGYSAKPQFFGFSSPVKNQPRTIVFRI
jgi:hypothetical protein